MQILDKDQHRALAYVSAANRGGYRPIADELHEWLTAPNPHEALTNSPFADLARSLKVIGHSMGFITTADPETFAAHLIRLGWLEKDERNSLGLTPLGRALLRTAEADEDSSEVPTAVVLGAQNELAYPMLIRRLAEAGSGLLIDPYLRLEQLLHVRTHTSIQRVLISAKLKREEQQAMAVLITSGAGANGPIELRVADKEVLHDRFIVGEEFVDTIGTSINTVGRQHPTVLTPLPSPAADTMREHAEKWWTEAKPLAAWPPPEAPDEH
jgi:hypothetical protein